MNTKPQKTSRLVWKGLSILSFFLALNLPAQMVTQTTNLTINVCCNETNTFSEQLGAAIIGSPGDLWNGTLNDIHGIHAGYVIDTAGNIVPGVAIGMTNGSYFSSSGGSEAYDIRTLGLMNTYYNHQDTNITMGISGLANYAGCPFTLVVYGTGNNAGQGDILNITSGVTQGILTGVTAGTTRRISAGIGTCYTNFTGTLNGADLIILATNLTAGGYCAFNGIQLQISGAPGAAPVISTQPQSITVLTNNTAVFTVPTVSSSAVTFQWAAAATGSGGPYTNLSNGGQFSGVNSPNLTITNVTPANALDYVVTVQNANGSVQSSPATLTVPAAEGPSQNPYRLIDVQFGANSKNGFTQSGAAVLGQAGDIWNTTLYYAGGPNILSSTPDESAVFAPTNIVDSWGNVLVNAGVTSYNWTGKASGSQGTPSDSATTNLMGNYIYTATTGAPSNAIVEAVYGLAPYVGENFQLVIYAAGNAAGQGSTLNILSGASGGNTASTLTTSGTSRQVSQGSGVAYNTFSGILTNATLTFSVTNNGTTQYGPLNGFQLELYATNSPPVIGLEPVSGTVVANTPFTNTVGASAAPGQTLSYQWYANGALISGATSSTLIVNPALPANGGTYYAVVSDSFGSVTSAVANLTLITTPSILTQFPVTYNSILNTNYMMLYPGANPTFSVTAFGGVPITYQWFTNGVLDGAGTTNYFTLTNAHVNVDVYGVAGNIYGSATSEVWSASVVANPVSSTSGLAPYPQAVLTLNPIAYWRLNDYQVEGDNGNGDGGYIAYDYASGNDAIYTNVYLDNSGYNPITDPSDTSAEFGLGIPNNSDAGLVGTNIDFSVPAGSNAEFTVSCWANWNVTNVCSLVTKGYGNGGEELELACDDKGFVRFGMRTANGSYYSAEAPIGVGNWFHVVGVCDEANTDLTVYVNGVIGKSLLIPMTSGLLNDQSRNLIIGARSSSLANDQAGLYNNQFEGYINDVAIFNYALNSNQVLALYNAAGIPPFYIQEPLSITNVDIGATLTVPAIASGTPTLTYKWYDENAAQYIPGQTNATLVVSNDTASDTYYVTTYNTYGSSNSSPVSVNVYGGAPVIPAGLQPQSPFSALLGETANNSVLAYGATPLAYQWQYSNGPSSWVNLSGSRFSGQSSTLAINYVNSSDAGFYQVVVTNIDGSITSSPAQLIVLSAPLGFNTDGANGAGVAWAANPAGADPAIFTNGVLYLTESNGAIFNSSYFYQVPQYVGAFAASFTYQAQYGGSVPYADGATFCLQDDTLADTAVGRGGGLLGVGGNPPIPPLVQGDAITPSVELELNIYPGNGLGGTGYCLDTNGNIGTTTPPGSVNLTNGPVDVSIYYANGHMSLTFSNEVGGNTFSTNVNVGDITKVLGAKTAYVGFTGASGGSYSIQTITNFTFVSLANQAIAPDGNSVVVSWPSSIGGYGLQESSSLNSPSWVNVSAPVIVTNGMTEVIVPKSGATSYYRMILLP